MSYAKLGLALAFWFFIFAQGGGATIAIFSGPYPDWLTCQANAAQALALGCHVTACFDSP